MNASTDHRWRMRLCRSSRRRYPKSVKRCRHLSTDADDRPLRRDGSGESWRGFGDNRLQVTTDLKESFMLWLR